MRYFHIFLIPFILLFFVSGQAFAGEQLIFAIDIIRHGDRTPIQELPLSPAVWPEGLGQLTPRGMQQENELGARLRAVYIEKYHLLPTHYQPGTIYVRSTDFDRTLMSAESFLMGLYPLGTGPTLPNSTQFALPQGFQAIPIHTLPLAQDSLLLPDHAQYHREELFKTYILPSPEWKAKNTQLQPRFSRWSKATGLSITSLDQLILLADNLYIRNLYHVPLPAGLTESDAQEIIEAGFWAFGYIYRNPMIGQITGRALLQTIYDYLHQATEHQSPLKYILFSAHDSTLQSQMSALGAPLAQVPHYASHLTIALYDVGQEHYRLRFIFNEKPVVIPACGGTECSLTQFQALAFKQ